MVVGVMTPFVTGGGPPCTNMYQRFSLDLPLLVLLLLGSNGFRWWRFRCRLGCRSIPHNPRILHRGLQIRSLCVCVDVGSCQNTMDNEGKYSSNLKNNNEYSKFTLLRGVRHVQMYNTCHMSDSDCA